jgi:hypothetical protein
MRETPPRTRHKRHAWKETRVGLVKATAILLDGPGAEWLLLVRGERTQPRPRVARAPKGARS